MIQVDLITGFLGSGKTTFLKKYAEYLISQGNRICILENDFGAVNVDMLMMQDLLGDSCDLEMVAGACDQDCHKRRFKTKLISMGMRGFDRVLIEPSGIFDVDEFFDTLREEPLENWYEIGNVIAIVDAGLEQELSEEAEFLLASQVANAGRVILSKVQKASGQEIAGTIAHLNEAMEKVHCSRRFDGNVVTKEWAQFTDHDFEELLGCGYVSASYQKRWLEQQKVFDSLYFFHLKMAKETFCLKVEQLMHDRECGKIFRVKGFLPVNDGKWLEVNATRESTSVKNVEKGQEVIIVIGEKMCEERIRGILES